MKVGDYYRTKYGINKLTEGKCVLNEIIKSSPNIIDLIEVGDYVNGSRVVDISEQCVWVEEMEYDAYKDGAVCSRYNNEDIKSIVTHEQFSQMEYKVGE